MTATMTLPNGAAVEYLNRRNTLSLYDEIFVDGVYDFPGLELRDGDTVVDVGANIGLFAVWALIMARVRLTCFEPRVREATMRPCRNPDCQQHTLTDSPWCSTCTVLRATYSDGVSVDVANAEDAAQIEGVERTLRVVPPPDPQKQETWRDRPPML